MSLVYINSLNGFNVNITVTVSGINIFSDVRL